MNPRSTSVPTSRIAQFLADIQAGVGIHQHALGRRREDRTQVALSVRPVTTASNFWPTRSCR